MDRRQFLKASAVGALVTSGPTGPGSFGVAVFAQTAAAGGANVKIPIHMSHGVDRVPTPTSANGRKTLTAEGMDALYRIARDMGFESIGYDDLERWRAGLGALPRRPMMIDFDHPTITMRYEVNDIMQRYGYRPTLFIRTFDIEKQHHARGPMPKPADRTVMTWDEVGELQQMGWHMAAHTVTHPNLSDLSVKDPSGAQIAEELDTSNATIQQRLGIRPRDFAYTGTSFSTQAEHEVMKRYRFGRLWIINSQYAMDGKPARIADVMGIPGADESDGGPPKAARYITKTTNPYRLPSMDTNYLINDPVAFRRYHEDALA